VVASGAEGTERYRSDMDRLDAMKMFVRVVESGNFTEVFP
jgi:hypothetical protein